MHNVWIGKIWGLSCTNLGSKLCTDNPRIGQILAHALLTVWHMYTNWMMVHREALEQQMKISFLSRKKVGSKLLTWESVCVKSTCMYRNTLFTDYVQLHVHVYVALHVSLIEWVDILAMHRNTVLSIIVGYVHVEWFSTKLTPLYLLSMFHAVLGVQSKDCAPRAIQGLYNTGNPWIGHSSICCSPR